MPSVVAFDDPIAASAGATALLGGKGAALAEMSRELGLPVPPGFIVTTEVCRGYLDGGWPDGLDEEIAAHIERLGEQLGRRLGDPDAPLLVSVRSGAPISMPGMMDTLLNVGMTEQIRERLAHEASPAFAADTWLRFCRMYAEVVLGVPREAIEEAAGRGGDGDDGAAEPLAAADRVRRLAAEHADGGIPTDPFEQVRGAVTAVFRSWTSERARVFREREGVSETLGTAVTIQAMVFGNLDDRSGTGVVFTRDPSTGDPGPYGDYLARAQGEDVVAGTHAVSGLDALERQLPEIYAELERALDGLERHYRDMCDVEFTVSEGRLYILQTRIGRRSPLAAVRIAVAMAEDDGFPLTRAEAVERVEPSVFHELATAGRVDPSSEPVATGLAASPGVGAGVLCCDPDRAADLSARGIAVVLAREETSPADIHGMVGAAGLVTTLGGVASHAAVVARSWAIPAITSLSGVEVLAAGIRIGDLFIAEGELVTVDGTAGALHAGDRREEGSADVPEVRTLREWAIELDATPGGDVAGDAALDPGRDADLTLLELARTVQLKGLCTAERAAAALAVAEARIVELFDGNASHFQSTPRGVALSVEGREWVTARLAEEREAVDTAALEASYSDFMTLNHRFKELVSNWQLSSMDGHSDEDWTELVEAVDSLHADLAPLLEETAAQLARLGSYRGKFDRALAEMHGGDTSMLASPMKDSYHTVWFEYHEELIELGGRDRAADERGESGG